MDTNEFEDKLRTNFEETQAALVELGIQRLDTGRMASSENHDGHGWGPGRAEARLHPGPFHSMGATPIKPTPKPEVAWDIANRRLWDATRQLEALAEQLEERLRPICSSEASTLMAATIPAPGAYSEVVQTMHSVAVVLENLGDRITDMKSRLEI